MVKFNGIIVEEANIKFFFKYDETASKMLHIYVRHLTNVDNALDAFFEGETKWNSKYKRFETFNKTHGLYWFWLNQEGKKVMIISCFRL